MLAENNISSSSAVPKLSTANIQDVNRSDRTWQSRAASDVRALS